MDDDVNYAHGPSETVDFNFFCDLDDGIDTSLYDWWVDFQTLVAVHPCQIVLRGTPYSCKLEISTKVKANAGESSGATLRRIRPPIKASK